MKPNTKFRFLIKHQTAIILFFITLLGFGLRIFRLNARSLWMDELFSVSDTNPLYSISKVWDNYLYSTHPPMNYIIQWAWYHIFGYNDFQARLPPMIFGVFAVVAIYFLGKALSDTKTGLIASFLLAINIFHIEYSQEARSYSLFCLAVIVHFYVFVKTLQTNKILWYVLFSFTGAFMIYSHYTGLFIIASQLVMLSFFYIQKDVRKNILIKYFIAFLSILVFITPLIPSILWLDKSEIGVDNQPEANTIVNYFSYYFGGQFTLVSVFTLFIIVSLACFAKEEDSVIFNKSNRQKATILLLWIFVGLTIPYIKSRLSAPTFHIRYTIGIFPAFILLIAFGISQIKNSLFSKIAIFFITILTFINIHSEKHYYNDMLWKSDFRGLAKEIVDSGNSIYTIWDLGTDGFADPIEPWAFYFRQNGVNPKFIEVNADDNQFLAQKGIWLISVIFSHEIDSKIEFLRNNNYEIKEELSQFHGCRAVLMLKKQIH